MNTGTRSIVLISVIAILMASVAFGATFAGNHLGATTSSSKSSTADCVQSMSSTNDTNLATVYHVNSSPAVLCVTYSFQVAGVTNFTTTVQPWFQNGSEINKSQCSDTSCAVPQVITSPEIVNHSASLVTVAYTIESPANMTGLFIVFHVGCNPIYLAFGSSTPSSVYLTAWTCGPRGDYRPNYNVTGATGIQTVFVPWH